MRSLSRLILIALLAQALLSAGPASAQTQDNTAVATNEKDGKSVFKLAFSVKKATGEVDAANTAVAYASCTDCKTVAAAIQVVLVSGEVTSASAENVAIAINYQCTECETMAAAYQFVFGDGQELEFTKEGKEKLHELKKRFHDLKQEELTLPQLAARLAVIAAEVAVVVDTETQVKKASEAPTSTTTTAPGSSTTTVPTSSTTSAPTTSTVPPPTSSTTVSTSTTSTRPPSSTTTTAAP